MALEDSGPQSHQAPMPAGSSPLSPSALAHLYIKPSQFFSAPQWLLKTPEVVLAAWLTGTTYAMNRVDLNILKADLRSTGSGWRSFGPWLAESWTNYWAFVLGFGVINAVILWYLGGWWYRKRLGWSGAMDIYPPHARAVYVYQDFVQSAPMFIVTAVQAFVYPNYIEAWRAEELWTSVVLIFVFWSCITSYKAGTTAFSVNKWKARLWFLILPIVMYLLAFGVFGTIIAALEPGAT